MSPPSIHVVFGAGQVGLPLARLLASRGHEVRLVSRSGKPLAGGNGGIQVIAADAQDAAACRSAAAGASAVYHCMNPRYEAAAWERELPRIQENLIAAAGSAAGGAGARLVVLDNLYAVGRTGGRPMDESTPDAPCSRKGEARARLAAALREAVRRGDVRAVTGRASDFFGPGGVQTQFGERFWTRLLAGKGAEVLGNPDQPHSYHFLPDVAAGLAALGEASEAGSGASTGTAWILPCTPAGTTRALVAGFAAALGRPVPVRRMPRLMVKGLGLFVPILREVDEMLYQWDEPFVADDRRFRERFGVLPTAPDEAARLTVAWATAAYTRST
jgi:nucleoside-diphosphate-sugar epimerase